MKGRSKLEAAVPVWGRCDAVAVGMGSSSGKWGGAFSFSLTPSFLPSSRQPNGMFVLTYKKTRQESEWPCSAISTEDGRDVKGDRLSWLTPPPPLSPK